MCCDAGITRGGEDVARPFEGSRGREQRQREREAMWGEHDYERGEEDGASDEAAAEYDDDA